MLEINNKDLYREYHYTARHEDILINSRTTIFFTANAFIFAGFISNLEKLPQYYVLAVIPFIFMQFSNYFYFSFILPAEISLKNIWDKIKILEKDLELCTSKNREDSFSKHRLLFSHVPYLNYIRIVTLSWFVISIISIQKISKNLYE